MQHLQSAIVNELEHRYKSLILNSIPFEFPASYPSATATTFQANFQSINVGVCRNDKNQLVLRETFAIRPAVRSLWEFLTKSVKSNSIVVKGPSGAGKSVAIAEYCCQIASTGRRVLYLRGTDDCCINILWCHNSNNQYYSSRIIDSNYSGLIQFLLQVLKNSQSSDGLMGVEMLVMDGFNQHIFRQCVGVLNFVPHIKWIICTTRSIDFSTERMDFQWYYFPAWTKEDYYAILSNEAGYNLFRSILYGLSEIASPTAEVQEERLKLLIEERFYYAGGNIRLFEKGGVDNPQWQQTIMNILDMIFESAHVHRHTMIDKLVSVNKDGQYAFLSEYVARRISSTSALAFYFLDAGYRYRFAQIPTVQEQMALMEVILLMREASCYPTCLSLVIRGRGVALWRSVDGTEEYKDFHDIDNTKISTSNNKYYFPCMWTAAVYDGLLLVDADRVKIFKVIAAATDVTLNSVHLIPLLQHLDRQDVEFVYICRQNFETFTVTHDDANLRAVEAVLGNIHNAKIIAANNSNVATPQFIIKVATYQRPLVSSLPSSRRSDSQLAGSVGSY